MESISVLFVVPHLWTGFQQLCRDPGSPSENGFMEPKYLPEKVISYIPVIIWRSVSQDPWGLVASSGLTCFSRRVPDLSLITLTPFLDGKSESSFLDAWIAFFFGGGGQKCHGCDHLVKKCLARDVYGIPPWHEIMGWDGWGSKIMSIHDGCVENHFTALGKVYGVLFRIGHRPLDAAPPSTSVTSRIISLVRNPY